ncbi:MAG: dihydroorotate dehydrogenase electron transfer subunit [Steroidobacteraceae bacterium]
MHRNTIFVEDVEILSRQAFAAQQYIFKFAAPKCASTAQPGQFIHLACDANVPMRRPLSIMRADTTKGTIEILCKATGPGLTALVGKAIGEKVSMTGPIGHGFKPHPDRPRTVLIGGGYGVPPTIFLAETLHARSEGWKPLVFMGSELPFPFRTRPSTIMVDGMPDGVIAALTFLDEQGIASRLSSRSDFPGCHDGLVTDLAHAWLSTLNADTLKEVELFVCGPTPLLRAAAQVARHFGIACQVSMEEYMACAVGGCYGCAVQVNTPQGPIMKRVCVDGPVFDAHTVFSA